MTTFNYVITDEVGIHARPAGLLVKEAKKYDSIITVECKGKKADARKLMALMTLGVKKDDEVTISVDGGDEAAVAQAMEAFFKENL